MRRGAIAAVLTNPYAGRYEPDILPLMAALNPVGLDLARRLLAALGVAADRIQGYGKGAIIGAVTMVTNDVIPYGLVQAQRGVLDGLNLVGLKRRGVPRSDITALRAAFQMLAQGEGTFQDRAERLSKETDSAYVNEIVAFVMGDTDRSFLTPR